MRNTIIATLVIISMLFCLTACTNYTYESKKIETTVVSCEQGSFVLASEYVSIANVYLAQQKTAMYTMYMNLARSNGHYNYNITITIDGENHVVVRSEDYEPGDIITVTARYGYADGELVSIEYD